jgi:tetratricopeptide (TPR) repeat protein
MPAEPRSLKELFLAALEVTPAERPAWLGRECPDADLRRHVELMLAAHDQPQSLLDRPAAAAAPPGEATGDLVAGPDSVGPALGEAEAVGTLVAGRYKLVEAIGEGGMGTVWMAQQTEPVKRLVALKVIKAGMDSKQVLARFEAERQALALMDHPNIARVLDAGATAAGRPFFVMELVKGVSITHYCDEHRLTLRQRLELFVPVCQAIQHAHQKGIIHRDVKPSNVLVCLYDGRPVPKVIDFGIAKAAGPQLTEQTLVTGFGTVVGTLEYMSPEQAEVNQLDIDTRSDIYSLGVLLYELLTGTTPLDRQRLREAAMLEVLRLIREEEPPRPSTRLSESKDALPTISAQRQSELAKLTRLVRGELDWVVMKALEKDRNRRYETANGLALDLQRYLADEPVQAGPPSATYRLRKFVRRHRGPVLAGLLLLLALVLGMAGTTVGLVLAEQARQAEAEQRGQTECDRDDKEKARALAARKAVEAQESAKAAEVAAEEERKARKLADKSAAAERLAKTEAEKATAAAIVAKLKVQKHLEQVLNNNLILVSIFRDLDPRREDNLGISIQAQLAEQLVRAAELLEGEAVGDAETVAAMQVLLGNALTNLGHARKAIPVYVKAGQTIDKLPGAKAVDKLTILHNLAEAYKEAGQLGPAMQLYQEVLEKRKATEGLDDPATLTAMNNLAVVYMEAGKHKLALPLAEDALARTRKAKGEADHLTLACMNNMAILYKGAGKTQQALAMYREVLDKTKARLGPDHLDTFNRMNNLACFYAETGQLDLALPQYVETFSKSKAKFGPNHPVTLASMDGLANVYRATGKLDMALALQLECLERTRVRLGADHLNTLISMDNLALVYLDLEKADLALPLLREAVETARKTLGPDHPHTLKCLRSLGVAYRRVGQFDEAVKVFRDQLEKVKASLGEDHPLTLTSMDSLAVTYRAAGKLNLAGQLLVKTLDKRKATLGADHPDTLLSMSNLGVVFAGIGRYDLALPLYEEALGKMKAVRPEHEETLGCMTNLADAYRATRKFDQAEPLLKAVLAKRKARQGADHKDTLLVMNNLGLTYHDWGKLELALPLFTEAAEKLKARLGADHPMTLTALNNVALTYLSKGQFAKAVPLYVETLKGRQARLGANHPDTVWSLHNLGGTYMLLGQYAEAEPLLTAWLAAPQASRPPDEFYTAGNLNRLGECQVALKKFTAAEKSLRDGLAIFEKKFPKSILRLDTENLLGVALAGQGKFDDAERLLVNSTTVLLRDTPQLSADSKRRGAASARRIIEFYTARGNLEEADRWRKLRDEAFPPPEKKQDP